MNYFDIDNYDNDLDNTEIEYDYAKENELLSHISSLDADGYGFDSIGMIAQEAA